jgi:hypothetical protein
MTDTPKTLLEAVRYFSDRKVCFEAITEAANGEGFSAGVQAWGGHQLVSLCGQGVCGVVRIN